MRYMQWKGQKDIPRYEREQDLQTIDSEIHP